MLKRILSLFLIVMLAVVPAATLWVNPPQPEDFSSLQKIEHYLRDNLIFGEELKEVAAEVLLQSGQKELDNIFYTKDGLLENYWPARKDAVRSANTKSVISFAQNHDIPVGVVVIPTAAAIKQKLVPDNAPLYNQKEAISDIYHEMTGKVTATDVYSTLYQNYDVNTEYLYYRTGSGLTSLGGYRVYEAIAERLRLAPLPLNRYSKEYLIHDYYGELTDSWGKNRVVGDILAVYRVTNDQNSYYLQVSDVQGKTTGYETMYPLENMKEDPFSIYMGGECAGFDLTVTGNNKGRSLLIFGDESTRCVAPFLSQHYDRITYCNLENADRNKMRNIDLEEYEQVLFLYSIETFCDSQSIQMVDDIP
ncbi:MAG: hypothetical protein IKU72_04975 [Oscillospiraceae bacterium]|nr:hypothetical protein [Oscillospiraceae bacterium]